MKNNRVLFVGSFKEKARDGSVGGQMFASRSLVHSGLAATISFIKLDTTQLSLPAPPVYVRALMAVKRLLTLFVMLLVKQPRTVLVFTSSGFSFWEKGLMSLLAKLVFGRRVVIAPRSGLIMKDMEQSKRFRSFLVYVFSKVDVVLCQGKEWKEYYQQQTGLPDSKFVIQKNWLDVSEYVNVKRVAHPNTSKIRLVYISWLVSYKGIRELVDAMKRIKEQQLQITLDVYGNGDLSEWLRNTVIEHGLEQYITYHGWADHPTKIAALSNADVFVLPSYTEGIPNSLLEAMSAELACIATNVGGIPSVLEHNVTGLMIQPQSAEELYNAVLELYHNPDKRLKLARDARQYAIGNHHIEQVIDKIGKILIPDLQ